MEFGPGSNPTALTAAPTPTPSLDIIPLYVFSAGSFLLCGLLGGGGWGGAAVSSQQRSTCAMNEQSNLRLAGGCKLWHMVHRGSQLWS